MEEKLPLRKCVNCGDAKKKQLRCSRCQNAYYCNVKCQEEDWSLHKATCDVKQAQKYLKSEQKLSVIDYKKQQHRLFSNGINALGYELVKDYLQAVLNYNKSSIVMEVGSGNGYVASLLVESLHLLAAQYFTIDPDKKPYKEALKTYYRSSSHLFGIPPHYPTVQDWKKAHPQHPPVLMFINWPLPNDGGRHYDMEAILHIRPKYLVIVYDSSGTAGGERLQQWLHLNGVCTEDTLFGFPLEIKEEDVERLSLYPQYMVVKTTTCFTTEKMLGTRVNMKCVLMIRHDPEVALSCTYALSSDLSKEKRQAIIREKRRKHMTELYPLRQLLKHVPSVVQDQN